MDTRLETRNLAKGVDSPMRKAWLFKWESVQPPLSLTTPLTTLMVREPDQGNVPMPGSFDPKCCPKPDLLALRARSSPLVTWPDGVGQRTSLASDNLFPRWGFDGHDRWMGIETPDTCLLEYWSS